MLGPLTKLPLKNVKVGRDPLTSMSRGVCYVEMNSVVDAMFLHNQLIAAPPAIDGKTAEVSYHKQAGPGQAEAVRWPPPVPPTGYAASHPWETGPPGPPPLDAPPQPEWDHWEPERSRQALEAWWKALAEAHSRRTGAGSSGDA